MSMERAPVADALAAFAFEAVPIKWVRANQAGDVPKRPYGTIYLASVSSAGTGGATYVDEPVTPERPWDVQETMREALELTVSFQVFGPNAPDLIAQLVTHARRPSTAIEIAGSINLGFMDAGPQRDLAQVISGSWEERAQVDLRFSLIVDSLAVIPAIKSVDLVGAGATQTVEAS